jgi:hypothetical protein
MQLEISPEHRKKAVKSSRESLMDILIIFCSKELEHRC